MRRVAEIAGVSAMTVSRALRNNPRVVLSERNRIQKIATKLGYLPDPEVAKLMSHLRRRDKAQLVAGLAAITSIPEAIEPPQLSKVREGARRRAEELGYRLELFRITAPESFNRQLERTLVSRGIEGVLLLQMENPAAMERTMDWKKFSVARATPSVSAPDFPQVEANYFYNARLLCAQLAGRGCKRIGFVGSKTFCKRTNEAFTAAAAWEGMAAGETPVQPLIFETYAEMREKFSAWMKRERPDAVVAHAENLLPAVEAGLAQVSGWSGVLACTSVNAEKPLCAGIDERHALIGRKAVDVLTGMLNRSEKNVRMLHASTLVDGFWVEP